MVEQYKCFLLAQAKIKKIKIISYWLGPSSNNQLRSKILGWLEEKIWPNHSTSNFNHKKKKKKKVLVTCKESGHVVNLIYPSLMIFTVSCLPKFFERLDQVFWKENEQAWLWISRTSDEPTLHNPQYIQDSLVAWFK